MFISRYFGKQAADFFVIQPMFVSLDGLAFLGVVSGGGGEGRGDFL